MNSQIDYRNAKYQGQVDKGRRNGLGILIDDDLSFYASHWKDGKLNDSTLVYISHGKYIYGQWQNNEPHGLNVFRIGDTVILGEFNNGDLINRILVIFERVNFITILQKVDLDEWAVVQRGTLKHYNDLIRHIEKANIPMQPHFFSLTKFLIAIEDNKLTATPCKTSENCFFGFESGLGIIFNPNNGVVSVGVHEKKMLYQYGGKYEGQVSFEGNFETNQVIKFRKQRPTNQIYTIFQKLHKRSLNFKNEYFDSKVKLLVNVEHLIRDKINEIVNEKENERNVTTIDLNDSLDYHVQSIEELNKINKMREEVYDSTKNTSQKNKYFEAKRVSPCVTPKKGKIYAPESPVFMKKSPSKKLDSSQISQRSSKAITNGRRKKSSTKINQRIQGKLKQNYENYEEKQSPNKYISKAFNQKKEDKIPTFKLNSQNYDTVVVKQEEDYKRTPSQFELPLKKEPLREKRRNETQSFVLKGPSYEDLSERRKRILQEFKELNTEKSKKLPEKSPYQREKPKKQKEYESPYIKERLYLENQKKYEFQNEVMPLSMQKKREPQRPIRDLSPYSYQKYMKNEDRIPEFEQANFRAEEREVEKQSYTPSKRKAYKYYFD